jgi:hypothetical protein
MAYPPLKVITNPDNRTIAPQQYGPPAPQPKVVVQPWKPQPKMTVVKDNPTTSKSQPPLQVAGPVKYEPLKVVRANPNTLGPARSNYAQLLQPSTRASMNANLDMRVVGVNGTQAPAYQAPIQNHFN